MILVICGSKRDRKVLTTLGLICLSMNTGVGRQGVALVGLIYCMMSSSVSVQHEGHPYILGKLLRDTVLVHKLAHNLKGV